MLVRPAVIKVLAGNAGVVELVDTQDLKSCELLLVRVQVPPLVLLSKEKIEGRPVWKPMHLKPVFENYPYYGNGWSKKLFEEGLCLPSGSNMTEENYQRIREAVYSFFHNFD